ncbi:MAG: hypothetical protein IKV54_00390 [Clostridia bacterium]|nr:hypothetical protein [Clostridia bacterium]
MKKLVSMLIVLSMLAAMLISCSSDGNDQPKHTTAATTAAESADPNEITTYLEPMDEALTLLNYGGETVNILARTNKEDPEDWSNWAGAVELYADELTNDPVNDSIYNRTQRINELLGVELREVEVDSAEFNQKVDVMVTSGDTTYDIVAASVIDGSPMIYQGHMYNLYDNGIDTYLDTTKPWWAQHWIEQAELGEGKLYSITGAPCLSLTRLMFVTYYNKNLGEDMGVEDLYTVVNEGRWTLDYVAELIPGIYRSLNGDDERDEEDQYGLAINHYENCDMFWSSCDMSLLSKDEDGWFEVNNTDKEKISNVFEKVYSILYDNVGTYDFGGSAGFDVARDMFASGNVLLATLHLRYAESEVMRNMQDEYGILPIPKYDEKQKEYYTYVHDQYSVLMVPKTVADPERCGAVMEAMAYESYKEVQPVYYNKVLKGRYANDPQSRQMLDTITTNVRIDAAWIYGRDLGMPAATVMRSLIGGKDKSFATAYAKVERMLPLYLKAMKAEIDKLDS